MKQKKKETGLQCISNARWSGALKDIVNTPNPLIMHTVLLPPGFDPANPALATAEIIQERTYKLKAGQLPDAIQSPAPVFETHVDPRLISRARPIPSVACVVSSQALTRTELPPQAGGP